MTDNEKTLSSQLEFLIAVDKLKTVNRKTTILEGGRKENSAEHSWHVILTAMTLAQHANAEIDVFKVIKMFAVHELGEIGSGDTFHYHKTIESNEVERLAVKNLFSILPRDQAKEFMALWDEFENAQTEEAKFAQAIDRIWPVIQNMFHQGGTWTEFNLSFDQVESKNSHIDEGSHELWLYISGVLKKAKEIGYLAP